MRILGIDPGFASIGWGLVEFDSAGPRLIGCGVMRTKRDSTAKKSEDNAARCGVLAVKLRPLMGESVDMIAIEAQSWTRRHAADVGVAMAWGVLSTLASERALPMFHVRPKEVKHRMAGRQSATKAEIIAAIAAEVEGAGELLDSIPKTRRDHAADAIACALVVRDRPMAQILARRGL